MHADKRKKSWQANMVQRLIQTWVVSRSMKIRHGSKYKFVGGAVYDVSYLQGKTNKISMAKTASVMIK